MQSCYCRYISSVPLYPYTRFSIIKSPEKRFNSSQLVVTNEKLLSMKSVNPYMKNIYYAVRGPILDLANDLQKELNQLVKGVIKPYNRIVKANIGDSHAMGQKYITYIRQVLAACAYPEFLHISGFLPSDVEERARQILASAHGSIGCYSDSLGCTLIRKQVAKFIENRDGYPCDYSNIFLTNGASSGIKMVLYSLMTNKMGKDQAGIMIPIPQYPLYSAAISELGGYTVNYYLDETNNWGINLVDLEKAYSNSLENCTPKAIVVINPGNPTGQVLSYDSIAQIIKFAKTHQLLIMADEVYQQNINDPTTEFYSFKKVLCDMGSEYKNVELISFHSASKGYHGECGIRGGYMELHGIDENIHKEYAKLMSTNLGSNLPGQIVISCITASPCVGDESYSLFKKEKDKILENLNKKANKVYKRLNAIDGITCNPIQGALYAFPRIHLTESAICAAKASQMEPDEFYCTMLLKEKGICVVPGNGFGQLPNTYHFRLTILPTMSDMVYLLDAISDFNTKFRSIYR